MRSDNKLVQMASPTAVLTAGNPHGDASSDATTQANGYQRGQTLRHTKLLDRSIGRHGLTETISRQTTQNLLLYN